MKDLNLSLEQQAQIQTIYEQNKQEIKPIVEQLKLLHQKRQSLGANATDDQLHQHDEQVKNVHQQLREKHFEEILAIRQVLTAEQRAKIDQKMPGKNQRHR